MERPLWFGSLKEIASILTLPESGLRILLCLSLVVLTAPLFAHLSPAQKHFTTIFGTAAMILYVSDIYCTIQSVSVTMGYYLVLHLTPASWQPYSGIIYSGCFLTIVHIVSRWSGNLTAVSPLMLLTTKLISLSFCLHDAPCDETQLSEDQKRNLIRDLPSFLELMSFTHFHMTFLLGPPIEFAHFRSYFDGTLFNDSCCKGKRPSSIVPATRLFLQAWLCVALGIIGERLYPVRSILVPSFREFSLLYRISMVISVVVTFAFRFAAPSTLTESALVMSGFAYNGYSSMDNKKKGGKPVLLPLWNRYPMQHLVTIFTASHPRDVINSWNVQVALWLKNYVYLRVPALPEGSPLALLQLPALATFVVSFLWHGFYFGYFHCAMFAYVLLTASRDIRRVFFSLFATSSSGLVRVLAWAALMPMIAYMCPSFLMKTSQLNRIVYSNMGWFGHYLLLVVFVVFKLILWLNPPQRQHRNMKAS